MKFVEKHYQLTHQYLVLLQCVLCKLHSFLRSNTSTWITLIQSSWRCQWLCWQKGLE